MIMTNFANEPAPGEPSCSNNPFSISKSMYRIDLVKLRKRAGLSQRELAEKLQVRASFLSAIENGKSRLPEEKLEKVKEIFEIDDIEDYVIDPASEQTVPPHTHTSEETDAITALLNHIHDLAHQRNRNNNNDEESLSRIDFLTKRNDRLSERIDDLRDEVDKLRSENLKLKELLIKNGISY